MFELIADSVKLALIVAFAYLALHLYGQRSGAAWTKVQDNDVDGADALAAVLTQSGHDVKVAYDGSQALSLAVGFAAEAVILDLAMPGMDGFEVARALRHEHGASLRLIAFSGQNDLATMRRVEATGFDDYVRKPASLARISTALKP